MLDWKEWYISRKCGSIPMRDKRLVKEGESFNFVEEAKEGTRGCLTEERELGRLLVLDEEEFLWTEASNDEEWYPTTASRGKVEGAPGKFPIEKKVGDKDAECNAYEFIVGLGEAAISSEFDCCLVVKVRA